MELSDYLRLLRRSWRLVLATTLLTVLVAGLLTALSTREYRAEAELFVSTAGGDSVSDLAQGGSFTQRQVATYADIVTTPIVLDPVIEQLGLDESASGLARRVTATVPPNTVLIDVAVLDEDPARATEIANTIAGQFSQTVQDLERVSARGESPVKASVVKPATIPETPASPDPLRNLALATVLGVLLGLGLALLRDLLDSRVQGESDVQRVTAEPLIGAIAFDPDAPAHPLVVEIDPHSPRAEAFRSLRTNLRYLDADDPPRTIVVSSTVPGEGKSTTTANLALTIARSGASVCLIEGDLRRPRLMDYLGVEGAVGLTDVLVGHADLEDVLQPWGDNLQVLGCGPIPPNPSELLGSDKMATLLSHLQERFDYVIIDSPPLLAVTDAAILATQADGVVIIVGSRKVRREELARALGSLQQVSADVLGLVLNMLPAKGPDAYSYHYQAYRQDPVDEHESRRARRQTRRASQRA